MMPPDDIGDHPGRHCKGRRMWPDEKLRGDEAVKIATANLKAICYGCPVFDLCDMYAMANSRDVYGVYAGRMYDPFARKTTAKPIKHGTPEGYQQHLRRGDKGEDIDTPCRDAYNEWHAATRGERKKKAA